MNRGRGKASLCNSLGAFSWICIQVEVLQARETKVIAYIWMSCWNQWIWGKDFIFRGIYQEGTPPNASIVFLQSCYARILVFLWLMKHQVLPHVKRAGYNAIQLIGIPEHKDYYTVGYRVSRLNFFVLLIVYSFLICHNSSPSPFQVTNFFAVSSRFGTPDDFKRLVDEAHGKYFSRLF